MEQRLTRVLVVEDHLVARLGTMTIITAQSDLAVCGEADCGDQAIRLHAQLHPDITVVDMRLPDMDGDAVIRRVRQVSPKALFLCLSTYDGEAEITRALRAGAKGYLVKDAGSTELLRAIRTVAQGSPYLSSPLAERVADYAVREQLSARELDVLKCLARGLANKEVAHSLTISEETVKSHVRSILSKLGVADRTAAVVRAVELGVIQLGRVSRRT
jgi:DNA-binding NarL/FixJ family response regulator